jgi:hypothetical protein
MSEVMTDEEMRAWRAWENGSPSRREFALLCATFDAREAKLVEALREAVRCMRFGELPLIDLEAVLYDTPAVEMPSDCHPGGQ